MITPEAPRIATYLFLAAWLLLGGYPHQVAPVLTRSR